MASMDVKLCQKQHIFDWDDINVGNIHLNHSQNFFLTKHYEHERIEEIELLQQKMIQTEISDSKNEEVSDEKENVCKFVQPDGIRNDANKTSKTPISNISKTKTTASTAGNKNDLQFKQNKSHKVTNLACEWSAKKTTCSQDVLSKGAVSKQMPPPPHAYLIKDIYQRKREEARRRRIEEEKKLREFHSRPAPNFNCKKNAQKTKPDHRVTVPVTPQVLKTSREAEVKNKQKILELKQKDQATNFHSRPPTVLNKKPYVPKKTITSIKQCPFNLCMEKRLQERKHYDEIKQNALKEKQKQAEIAEEQRKRLEIDNIKSLRKAATFKATPNPFKH